MNELQKSMPPGWDCKFDEKSGKYYYINHHSKTTTWEDPRNRHRYFQVNPKQTQGECIPLQHGSPDSRRNYVYPSQTSPIPAFQMPTHVGSKGVLLQDLKPRMSPMTVRSAKLQEESSLSTSVNTDEVVTKISAMFPTVSETHIRILMKNCRYMKSIFPNADETVILEVLQNNENNIQKTSDSLKEMGYSKKDTVKIAQQKLQAKKEEERKEEERKNNPQQIPEPKVKSLEEKEKLKKDLQKKYKDTAEHLITIALESVNFDEDRANQILQIMIQEDTQVGVKTKHEETLNAKDVTDLPSCSTSSTSPIPVSQSRQSIKSLLKSEKDTEEVCYRRIIRDKEQNRRSLNLSNTNGHNPAYAKGPNEKLLLEDYVKWQGGNPNIKEGSQGLACGPNKNLLTKRTFQVCGPNQDLRRGHQFGLAKGSMFSQLKTVTVGQSCFK